MKTDHHGLQQIVKTLSTKSAANPGLIFAATCLFFGGGAAILTSGPIQIAFLAIAVFAVLLVGIQIIYFTFTNPDRLQDEKHVENKMLIERRQVRGDAEYTIEIAPNDLKIPNTAIEDKRNV